jgi:hypothetical protein
VVTLAVLAAVLAGETFLVLKSVAYMESARRAHSVSQR